MTEPQTSWTIGEQSAAKKLRRFGAAVVNVAERAARRAEEAETAHVLKERK